MSQGTRSAVARAAAETCSLQSTTTHTEQIAALEQALLLLPGKANQSERNKLNKQLWALQQQQLPPPQQPLRAAAAALPQAAISSAECSSRQQVVADHWFVLRPDAPQGVPSCVRCGDATAATCDFHPDAKAFAFGSGRFDYCFTSLWDTPHDGWMCCNGAPAGAPGCCREPTHTTDPEWWRAYAHMAPALPQADDQGSDEDSDSADGEEDDEDPNGATAMALEAMDIS